MMHLAIFAVFVMAAWAYYDAKLGEIGNYWLSIPIGIGFFLDWLGWTTIFLPLFLGFLGMYWVINKKTTLKFGFADVMALPFALWVVIMSGFVVAVTFALVLALQTFIYDRIPRFLVPEKVNGNIKYIPVVFNALLVAVVMKFLLSGV